MTEVRPDDGIEDKSLGELVALASGNVSRLIRSEMELAKLELKSDAKKAALGGTLFGIAGVIVCMVFILLSISLAYFLVDVGMSGTAAFATVAGAYVLLALLLCGIGYLGMSKIGGLKRTRSTMGDLAMLRRGDGDPEQPAITK
jgi:hypothetical protein